MGEESKLAVSCTVGQAQLNDGCFACHVQRNCIRSLLVLESRSTTGSDSPKSRATSIVKCVAQSGLYWRVCFLKWATNNQEVSTLLRVHGGFGRSCEIAAVRYAHLQRERVAFEEEKARVWQEFVAQKQAATASREFATVFTDS
eukprot:4706407-Amphidinium_carterae.1